MKNRYLHILILLLAVSYSSANAQISNKKGKIEFGLQGGINTSTADTHLKTNTYRLGYQTGATFTYYMGDAFSLNTGLEYALKGSNTKQDFKYPISNEDYTFTPDGSTKMDYKMGYLQLPVTIGYEFIQKDKLSLDFRFGFNFAYGLHISAHETIKGTLNKIDGSSISIDQNTKFTNWNWLDMHRFDFGVLGGMTLKYDRLFIKATYNYGLTNIGNAVPNDSKYKFRWKNRDLALSIGYNFIVK